MVGSANLDTQTLNHSREVNVVVDGSAIVQAWDARLFAPTFARSVPVRRGSRAASAGTPSARPPGN